MQCNLLYWDGANTCKSEQGLHYYNAIYFYCDGTNSGTREQSILQWNAIFFLFYWDEANFPLMTWVKVVVPF